MNNIKNNVQFLILCLILSLTMFQIDTVSVSAIPTAIDIDAIESYIESEMNRHRLKAMAVAITQGDEITYLGGFGSAGGGQPVTPDTPFYIGSISKSFTALAVMQLVDQGLISLDSPVQSYLPWFSTADEVTSSEITVRHLLNQTSGLSDASFRRPLITEKTTLEETVRHLSQAELTATPGSTFQYFNPNYNVLAQVIEVVAGQPYTDYVRENIFSPLAMKHSFVDLETAQQFGLATGHSFFFGFPIPRQQRFYPAELPAGFIISAATDMANYQIAQLNNGQFNQEPVVSAQAINTMHTPPKGVQSDYAMGWVATERDDVTIIRHNGAVDTFYADIILLPDEGIGLTLLINQNALLPLILAYGPLADGLVDIILGNPPTPGPSMGLVYA